VSEKKYVIPCINNLCAEDTYTDTPFPCDTYSLSFLSLIFVIILYHFFTWKHANVSMYLQDAGYKFRPRSPSHRAKSHKHVHSPASASVAPAPTSAVPKLERRSSKKWPSLIQSSARWSSSSPSPSSPTSSPSPPVIILSISSILLPYVLICLT
jgi:hypothetical protein